MKLVPNSPKSVRPRGCLGIVAPRFGVTSMVALPLTTFLNNTVPQFAVLIFHACIPQSLKRVRYSGLMPYVVFVASPRLERLVVTRRVGPTERPRRRLGTSASSSFDMDSSQIYTVSRYTCSYCTLCSLVHSWTSTCGWVHKGALGSVHAVP